MRVVSLLPSATETLCHIGGESLLVGRSHECDHPAGIAELPVLTSQRTHGTTSLEIDQEVRDTLDTPELRCTDWTSSCSRNSSPM